MKMVIASVILLALSFIAVNAQVDDSESGSLIEISDDIEPYAGSIDPGNVVYGLKIAFENLDEGFTFNGTRKLEKQELHARLRIAEAKAELRLNNFEDAERALEIYREKIRASEMLVAELEDEDTGLLQVQKNIVKHQFVLANLLASHPNVTGLERAFNNSIELEDRFELKTRKRLARIGSEDGQRIKIRTMDREEIEVRARITDNASDVRVEVRFLTASTEPDTLAQEILSRFNLSRENISLLLDIEVEEEELKRELDAKAEVRRGISNVEAEFRFPLNATSRTGITEGIFSELSSLKKSDVLNVLEIRDMERPEIGRKIEKVLEREDLEIKAETFDNTGEARVELEFLTERTEPARIAQEIQNRLNLSREEVGDLLKVEAEEEEIRPKEKLEVEVKSEKGVTEVKFELRFPLNTTGRSEIIERIYQKLSTMTLAASDIEFRERQEERREDRIEDRRDGGGNRNGGKDGGRD